MIKGVNETIQNEAKEPKGGFLSILLCIFGANLLGNLLAGKTVKVKIPGQGVIRACEEVIAASRGWGMIRASQDF